MLDFTTYVKATYNYFKFQLILHYTRFKIDFLSENIGHLFGTFNPIYQLNLKLWKKESVFQDCLMRFPFLSAFNTISVTVSFSVEGDGRQNQTFWSSEETTTNNYGRYAIDKEWIIFHLHNCLLVQKYLFSLNWNHEAGN